MLIIPLARCIVNIMNDVSRLIYKKLSHPLFSSCLIEDSSLPLRMDKPIKKKQHQP